MNVIEASPPSFVKEEEWLKFRVEPPATPANQGGDVVVVSGYAHYHNSQLQGSSDGDLVGVPYVVRLFVGPSWRDLNDVSPSAFIAGFRHYDSDEADMSGRELESCTWEWVGGPDNPDQQIRLIMSLYLFGGPSADVTVIGYHLTARGWLLTQPPQDFKELTG